MESSKNSQVFFSLFSFVECVYTVCSLCLFVFSIPFVLSIFIVYTVQCVTEFLSAPANLSFLSFSRGKSGLASVISGCC
jgi:hypothetical protein